jgi:hypothetical protein
MCSVIKNVNKAVLIQTFMSDVIHCFALKKIKKISVLSIEFYKILRRKLKATNMGEKKIIIKYPT